MKTPACLLALALIAGSASGALAAGNSFATFLSGFNEVHFAAAPMPALRGAVSTPARGSFRARIDRRNDIIHYELRYAELTGAVTQAHIHFGQTHTVGGIVVWLCQTPASPAPEAVAMLTPECPGPTEGVVSGTITPAQVVEVAGQGLAAMQFDALVDAIRAGATYANVHSATFPPGEIRGQVGHGLGHGR